MTDRPRFSPSWYSAPGDTIADVLRERGLSLSEFAQHLGEPSEAVSDLLSGRSAITIGLARRLHDVLGASVEFWITRDSKYRDSLRGRLADDVRLWLADLPIADMIRFGWLAPQPLPSEEASACLRFFGVPDLPTWSATYANVSEAVAFRTSRSIDSQPGAVAAWLRRGSIEAEALGCSVWNPEQFRVELDGIRRLTRLRDPRRFVPELQRRCSACGVAVVVLRSPTGCRASGATQFMADGKGLLLLSSRYLTDDQFWFTLFHEAGHLLLHGHRRLILEGLDSSPEVEEEQANAFAERLIVPAAYREDFRRLRADSKQVLAFARRLGISPGLIVGQLQFAGILRPNQLNGLKRRFSWSDAALVSRERA